MRRINRGMLHDRVGCASCAYLRHGHQDVAIPPAFDVSLTSRMACCLEALGETLSYLLRVPSQDILDKLGQCFARVL